MRHVILLSAAVALGLAPAPLPKQPLRFVPSLEGEWEVLSWRMQMTDSHALLYEVPRVRIASGRLEWRTRDEFRPRWKLALDPGAFSGRLDLTDVGSDRVLRGIYRLEGG